MSSPCLLIRNSLPVRQHLRYEENFALRWGHQYSSRNLQKAWLPIVRESGSGTGTFLLVESGLRETFVYGICNPGPYFGIQLKESRVPRTIGIHNPSTTVKAWDPVPGIRNPRLGIQNPRFHYMGRRGAHVLAGLAFANGTRKSCKTLRACSHGGGAPQVGEVTRLGVLTRLSI